MNTLDWAHDNSVNGTVTINDWEKDHDEPGTLDGVTVTGRRSGLLYSGELSLSDISGAVQGAGFSAEEAPNASLSIASRVVENMNGRDLATVGVSIPETTTPPSGHTIVDYATLNYPGNTPLAFNQLMVTVSNFSHQGYAYIDSDFNGAYDRVIQLGMIG